MVLPKIYYKAASAATLQDKIVEALKEAGLECEVEKVEENVTTETLNFYCIRIQNSNFRVHIYTTKPSSQSYVTCYMGVQGTSERITTGTINKVFWSATIDIRTATLTISTWYKDANFYLMNIRVGNTQYTNPSFIEGIGITFGRLNITEEGLTKSRFVYSCDKMVLKIPVNLYDGKEGEINGTDSLNIAAIEFYPYIPESDWNIFVLPTVMYTNGQSVTGGMTVKNVNMPETRTIWGRNMPAFSPIRIDGKSYMLIDTAYRFAVQAD